MKNKILLIVLFLISSFTYPQTAEEIVAKAENIIKGTARSMGLEITE